MKKILFILLIAIIAISGCSKNEVDNSDLSFTKWAVNNIKIDNEIKRINCPFINENSIMSGSDKVFITDDNIYKYDVDKLFSNDMNCKLVGKITNPMAVKSENAIDEDGILYNDFWQKVDNDDYDGDYVKDNYHDGWKKYLSSFDINKKLVSARDIYSSDPERNIPNHEIITYVNNELYLYNIDYMSDSNGKSSSYKVNTDSLGDEEIIKIYGSIVKTNKAFYIVNSNLVNKEECSKYVDIKCIYEYSLKKDEVLTKYYDEILNITNKFFITKDYDLVSIGGYFYIP